LGRCHRFGRDFWLWYHDRCRHVRQHTFDDGFLLVVLFLAAARDQGRVFHLFGHLVAGFDVVQSRVIVLQAFELVVRCLERFVGHQQHVDALLHLDFCNL
jgi:hypothetical protein